MKKYKVVMKNGNTYHIESANPPSWVFDPQNRVNMLTIGGYGEESVFHADDVEAVIYEK